jgi:thiol:disulfide interchange protein DsbC
VQTGQADPALVELAGRLARLYPATRFDGLTPSPVAGFYEVVLGNSPAYVDASGRYFLFGHLFDMAEQRDLTAERLQELQRVDFARLALSDAITEVRGDGRRVLAVFSDPDCPYCRQLEAQLSGLTDVTIHLFLMPLEELHPLARRKAISVWCASDRLQAWRAVMRKNLDPVRADCPNPLDRILTLAQSLGLQATPTLIASDGRMAAGAMSAEQLETWLEGPARKSGTAQTEVTSHAAKESRP